MRVHPGSEGIRTLGVTTMDWRKWLGLKEPELAPAAPPSVAPEPAALSVELSKAVDDLETLAHISALPSVVASRLDRLVTTLRATIPRLSSLGPGSSQAYDAVAITMDYLPDAVQAYLRLPRAWADSRPVDAGRTSLMVLVDQLDLIAATMDEVYDAVCRADAEALVLHGRFLAERLGPGAQRGSE